ncbi:hypothetical protein D3C78_1305930 [compost metagenome]
MNGSTANSSSSRKKSIHFDWEKAIAEVEDQLGEIDAKMLDPLISSNAAELAELQKERDAVQEQLDELYAGWMETAGH